LEGTSLLDSSSFESFPSDESLLPLLFHPQPMNLTSNSCTRSSQSSREDSINPRAFPIQVSFNPLLSLCSKPKNSRLLPYFLSVLARHYAHLEALAFDGAWDQTEAEKVEDKSAPLWESMHDVSRAYLFILFLRSLADFHLLILQRAGPRMKKWNASIKGDPMASSIVVKTKKASSTAEKRKAEVVRLLLSFPFFLFTRTHLHTLSYSSVLYPVRSGPRYRSGGCSREVQGWNSRKGELHPSCLLQPLLFRTDAEIPSIIFLQTTVPVLKSFLRSVSRL